MIKRMVFILYVAVLIVLGAATFIEHSEGRTFALTHIYGAWWFSLLWALLAAFGIAWIVKRRVSRWFVWLLHGSFVLILAGAFITHLFSRQGVIHLRQGESTNQYYVTVTETGMRAKTLPFQVELKQFDVAYHDGTEAAADYVSHITITDKEKVIEGIVSMNNIFSYRGFRLYQNSFDDDLRGSLLSINNDPWGIGVTYLGYGLLFFSLIWLLIDPKGTFRRLLRSPLLRQGAAVGVLLMGNAGIIHALPTLPKETAKDFGKMHILYNDRICPLQTFAIDFTKKLYGKAHYGEYSAEQVLAGFIFWGDEWANEPIVKVKGGELRGQMHLDKYVCVNALFNPNNGEYRIGPYLQGYYNGKHDAVHKQAMQLDDKLMLVMNLRSGALLKVFPNTHEDKTIWVSPAEKLPATVDTDDAVFISSAFNQLYHDTQSLDFNHFSHVMGEIKDFQVRNSGVSMPSNKKDRAEYIYNKVPFATILFMVNLTMGILSLLFLIWELTRKEQRTSKRCHRAMRAFSTIVLLTSFLTLTACIALRWVIKGTLPMSNGYETMLFIAWFVMLITLLVRLKMPSLPKNLSSLIVMAGFLSSGFFLLVSHISQMDPQITHLMPVLNSPLLSLHVSVIMMSYALLSLTFVCGVVGLVMKSCAEQLAVLSRIMLYPSLTTMGLGVFIGAIWANVSWGQYWSWDPKETWALITFMVYAIAVHQQSLPAFRRPLVYHAFMVLAFLTILMTYFGVNYFLGGMHSYA
ncbi:MAG: cytochrome c biogenesis protein CcsA [Prevotella sp.]|nr:cytochrome c biogenesis protein CcsA [Prevotella sp.]